MAKVVAGPHADDHHLRANCLQKFLRHRIATAVVGRFQHRASQPAPLCHQPVSHPGTDVPWQQDCYLPVGQPGHDRMVVDARLRPADQLCSRVEHAHLQSLIERQAQPCYSLVDCGPFRLQ